MSGKWSTQDLQKEGSTVRRGDMGLYEATRSIGLPK